MSQPARQCGITVEYIDATQVSVAWPDIYETVAGCCGIALTPGDIYNAIAKGTALAWVVVEDGKPVACAVTQGREKSGRRWLDVVTLGRSPDAPFGGFERWGAALQARLELHMRDHDQEMMRCHGRPGLEPWLRSLGWRKYQVVMEYRDNG